MFHSIELTDELVYNRFTKNCTYRGQVVLYATYLYLSELNFVNGDKQWGIRDHYCACRYHGTLPLSQLCNLFEYQHSVDVTCSKGNPIMEIRRSNDHLISNIESGPRWHALLHNNHTTIFCRVSKRWHYWARMLTVTGTCQRPLIHPHPWSQPIISPKDSRPSINPRRVDGGLLTSWRKCQKLTQKWGSGSRRHIPKTFLIQ